MIYAFKGVTFFGDHALTNWLLGITFVGLFLIGMALAGRKP